MRFRIWNVSFFCWAALVTAVLAGGPVRLNVLFIAVDDLRPSLGCYGDSTVKSPNIDRLAQGARLFSRAYTQQAVCGPSRTALLTGRLPDHTRVWHNRNLFRDTHPDAVTLPQHFKNSGYHAQAMGKIFSGNSREAEQDPTSWSVAPLLRGPDWNNYALPETRGSRGKGEATEQADVLDEGYPDGKLAQLAIETLKGLAEENQPFFLAVGFFRPHLPFNAPKKYWDLYDPSLFRLTGDTSRTKNAPDVAYPDHLELGGYKNMPDDENVGVEKALHLRHGYYACVSYVDEQVGRVLAALEGSGLADKTIVVLWGDHGYSLGEADHWCKDTNFELDTHVPLIIRVPGIPEPGVPSDALVEYVDVFPTLIELAGLPSVNDLDGASLVPILEDPHRRGRSVVLSQFSRPFKPSEPKIMGYSIRTALHRYTRWIDWPTREVLEEELYDYTLDRSAVQRGAFLVERENVVNDSDCRELRDRLRIQMDDVLNKRILSKGYSHPARREQ